MAELKADLLVGRDTLNPALDNAADSQDRLRRNLDATRGPINQVAGAGSRLASTLEQVGEASSGSALGLSKMALRLGALGAGIGTVIVGARSMAAGFRFITENSTQAERAMDDLRESFRRNTMEALENNGAVDAATSAIRSLGEFVDSEAFQGAMSLAGSALRLVAESAEDVVRGIEGSYRLGLIFGDWMGLQTTQLNAFVQEQRAVREEAQRLQDEAGEWFVANLDFLFGDDEAANARAPRRRGRSRTEDRTEAILKEKREEDARSHYERLQELKDAAIERQLDADREFRQKQAELARVAMERERAEAQAQFDLITEAKIKREELAAADAAAADAAISGAVGTATAIGGAIAQMIQNDAARAVVRGLVETAEATASFASLDFRGGILHSLAAGQYFYAASQAGKGGGGGAGASAGGGSTSSASAATPRVRESTPMDYGSKRPLYIIHQHGVATSKAEASAGIVSAANTLARRNTGRRFDQRLNRGSL